MTLGNMRPKRTGSDEVDRGMRFDRRRKPPMKSLVVKKSVLINGRSRGVSMESAFWNALKTIAVAQNISINAIVPKIDSARQVAILSSAIRVYVVEHYRLAAKASADPQRPG